jgi:fatty-acyl-CoA synthase
VEIRDRIKDIIIGGGENISSVPGQTATEEELIGFVRVRLAHFKAPRGVTFVTDLPKTATGKVQKYVLRGGAASQARP